MVGFLYDDIYLHLSCISKSFISRFDTLKGTAVFHHGYSKSACLGYGGIAGIGRKEQNERLPDR